MRRSVFFTIFSAAFVCAVPALAANPTIGVATAIGEFSLNSATVAGNVDVFDGAQLRTTTAPSDVRLGNGVAVRLATRSAGVLYEDHLILREGAARLASFDKYPVEAGDFQIHADNSETTAIVRVTPKTIEIASLGGAVTVTDGGAMLTHVASGAKMVFQNTNSSGQSTGQSGATPAAQSQPAQTQPAQTGAAPAPAEKGPISDKKAILVAAGVVAVGAIVVGALAASEGKSPF